MFSAFYSDTDGTGAPPPLGYCGAPQPMNQFIDPNNATVFIRGLVSYATEDTLRSFFQGVGKITYVKIPPGKGCDYVQFVLRHAAKMTINQMQGQPIGNSLIRLSWGHSQSN
jgi:RNA recognition motif-containing protein